MAAGLGTLALFVETHQEHHHPGNLLREVWEGPRASRLFPSSVWRYLTRQSKAKLEGKTYRTELIKSWKQEGGLGEPGSDIEKKGLRCSSVAEESMNCKISAPGPQC